jgi:hypothetical protein
MSTATVSKTNLMGASNEWGTRPADERFWGLNDMGEALDSVYRNSHEHQLSIGKIHADTATDEATGNAELVLKGRNAPVKLTHWSMGQLARYADAPADYIRKLPAPLAAQCINNGLDSYRDEDAQLMFHKGDNDIKLRSMTTQYSRLWNRDIVEALKPALDKGWMVPPARPCMAFTDPRARPATLADIVPGQDAFGLAVKVGDTIAPAGCYASDRDMFVFLVNPNRVIDVDGSEALMRGVFIWNSEVGAGAFKIQTFYLEAVCGNHIVWGASGVETYRLVHKGRNFENFGGKLGKQLVNFANQDTTKEQRMIESARNYVLGKDREEVVDTLYNNKSLGLTKQVIDATYSVAISYEHTAKSSPRTAWGMAHALTRYSQRFINTDERTKLDTSAGKLLQLAYTAKN